MPTKQRRTAPVATPSRPPAPETPDLIRTTGRDHRGTRVSYDNEGAGKVFRPTREGGIIHKDRA